jgi:hypothetical protein
MLHGIRGPYATAGEARNPKGIHLTVKAEKEKLSIQDVHAEEKCLRMNFVTSSKVR